MMRCPTRKRSIDFSKSADALFSCLNSDESRHCATHLPVRKIADRPLPSEGATSPPSDRHQAGGEIAIAFPDSEPSPTLRCPTRENAGGWGYAFTMINNLFKQYQVRIDRYMGLVG